MDQHSSTHACEQRDHSSHEHACHHSWTNPSVHQTLHELAFERGIWNSALSGDFEDVKQKIKRNVTCVNDEDKSGYTPLHYACRSGHVDICRLLLSQGANVNAVTYSGNATPLHRAAYMGHCPVVQLLLDHGADVLVEDSDGMTPLHKAADRGHVETVQALVTSSPTALGIKDNKGRTPADMFNLELQTWLRNSGLQCR